MPRYRYSQVKIHYNVCKVCDSLFVTRDCRVFNCSRECGNQSLKNGGRVGGRISAKSQSRRSKNEILFSELCSSHFSNVETNIPFFNGWDADVIIHDLKLAVLWNGKWHYEQLTLTHSLKQVQSRDAIKMKEIENFGYFPYVIKDLGKYNPIFVEEEFRKIVALPRIELGSKLYESLVLNH